MALKGVCSYRVFLALLLSFMSCLPSTGSFQLKFSNDYHSITVENGVESNVDFFLDDFPSLNRPIRIIVQHQRADGTYDKKCQIEHSKTSGCNVALGSCQCVGEKSGKFQYRLKMTFTQEDKGSLYFSIVNSNQFFVNVNVVAARTTIHPSRTSHRLMLIHTTATRPTTIRLKAIPSPTTTPTTTSPKVDVATVATTTHFVVDAPGPHVHETENNNVDGEEDEDAAEESEPESEQSEFESDDTPGSSGAGFVVMNMITISFLMLATNWGLV